MSKNKKMKYTVESLQEILDLNECANIVMALNYKIKNNLDINAERFIYWQ